MHTREPYEIEWDSDTKLLVKFGSNSELTNNMTTHLAEKLKEELREQETIMLQVPRSLLGRGRDINNPDIQKDGERSYLITLDWNSYGAGPGLYSVADIMRGVNEGERYPSHFELNDERYTFDALCAIRLPMKSGSMSWGNMAWGGTPSMDFRSDGDPKDGFTNHKITGLDSDFIYMLYYSYPRHIYLITSINSIPSPPDSVIKELPTLGDLLSPHTSSDEECYRLLAERSSGDMQSMLPNHRAAKFNLSDVARRTWTNR